MTTGAGRTTGGRTRESALDALLGAAGSPSAIARSAGPRALSPYQDRIWRGHLAAGSAAYAVPCVFDLIGDVDTARVIAAVRAVLAAEPGLTGTVEGDGDGYLLVPGTGVLEPEHIDADDADAAAREVLCRPFTGAEPLTRFAVIRSAGAPDRIALVFHHVVIDGAALSVLLQRIAAEAHLPGSGAACATGPAYADVARVREDAGVWWRERLLAVAGTGAAPWVPAADPDHGRVTRGTVAAPAPPPGTVASVVRWLTAIAVVLARVSGHPAQCLAVPLANRTEVEDFDAIGPLVNTLPLFVLVRDDEPLSAVQDRVERELTLAVAHAATDLRVVIDDVRARHPEFWLPMEVLVNIQSAERTTLPLPGGFARPAAIHSGDVKGVLTVSVNTAARDVQIESALADWTGDSHNGFRDAVGLVLRALEDRPGVAAAAVDLGVFGAPSRVATGAGSIVAAIAEHAHRDPGTLALTAADGELTRGELNHAIAETARALAQAGVRRGDAVLLTAGRDTRFVIRAAAIMAIGAAYVPVDPERGAARIRGIAERTGARLGVSTVPLDGVRTIDPAAPAGPPSADERLDPVADPSLAAYILFTSGTTGEPKGIPVTHADVLSLLDSTTDLIDEDDVVSAVHAFTFDYSVWEVWIALARGARVVVYDAPTVRDPFRLRARLDADAVTVLSLTNTALGSLVTAVEPGPERALPAVRRLVLGGEAVAPPYVRAWWDRVGDDVQVVNMLGATETTVHTTRRDVTPADLDHPVVQVGGALRHLDVVVVDQQGRSLPVGFTGEIAVRGGALACGYVGRPGLTAARFLPDPFDGAEPGARLYLTGDAGRWLTGGDALLCVGRGDGQVKVRGHRIETAGVEAVLERHPAVLRACVVADDNLLHAFVRWMPGTAHDAGEVREHAAAHLAGYEVPDRFHEVAEFPVTVNGKLDRDVERLRAAASGRPTARTPDAAFAGQLGESGAGPGAVAIIEEILGGTVDPEQSFLANGGDSISAVRVVGELRARGVRLTVGDLLQATAVSALDAPSGESDGPGDGPEERVAPFALIPEHVRDALPYDVADAYPLSAAQEGMLFHIRADPDVGVYHNTVSIRIHGGLDPDAFRVALADTVRRHEVLRTSVDELRHDEPLQLVHRHVTTPLTVVEPAPGESDQVIDEIVDRERSTPFELERAPLFRITLVRVGPDVDQLIIGDSHLILDGWSWTSTLAEIVSRHNALVRRDPGYDDVATPDRRARFADFVALERRTQADGAAARAWAEHLRGALPWTIADTGSGGRRVGRTPVPVPPALAARLAGTARAAGVSLRHLAMAVHLRAVSEVLSGTGAGEVLTGVTANGRLERPGGTDTRGMFLNMLPLRFPRLPGAMEQARACSAVEAGMAPHRRLPNIDITRGAGRGPLFDYGFNFVQFHRLGEVEESHRFGSADDKHFSQEDTDFAFMATFSVHPPEHRLALMLIADEARVGPARRAALARAYAAALEWAVITDDLEEGLR